jgi:hypothetical protein
MASSSSGWRPPQWSQKTPVYIQTKDGTQYFFDAIIREDHSSQLRTTEHPVQSGSNITDHAYMLPSRLTIVVGFSDAMESYKTGQYTSGDSRSITAHAALLTIQQSRLPITVYTDLRYYRNMVIETLSTTVDNKTMYSKIINVVLKQIIMATSGTTQVSSRSQTTDSTSAGTSTTTTATSAETEQVNKVAVGE